MPVLPSSRIVNSWELLSRQLKNRNIKEKRQTFLKKVDIMEILSSAGNAKIKDSICENGIFDK
jgi:hypothetical protein